MKKLLILSVMLFFAGGVFAAPTLKLHGDEQLQISNPGKETLQLINLFTGGAVRRQEKIGISLAPKNSTNLQMKIPQKGGWWARIDFKKQNRIVSEFFVFDGRKPAEKTGGRIKHKPFIGKGVIRYYADNKQAARRVQLIAGAGLTVRKMRVKENRAVWQINEPSIAKRARSHKLLLFDPQTAGYRIITPVSGRWPYWRYKLTHVTVIYIILVVSAAAAFWLYWRPVKGTAEGRRRAGLATVALLGILAFASLYYLPPNSFWDEGYHISSAQKYLDGKAFMESHPPLGKQLIALGEALVGQNDHLDLKPFTTVDKVKSYPPGYSFVGPRLLPTVLAALAGVFFYLLIYNLSGSAIFAVGGTLLYLLDNATVVHCRAAMLEGSQFFFLFWALWYFFKIYSNKPSWKQYLLLGIPIGLASAVKVNGLVLLLLFPVLAVKQYWHLFFEQFKKKQWRESWPVIKQFLLRTAAATGGFLLPMVLSWYLHFAMGSSLIPGKTYHMSDKYQQIVKEGKQANPLYFPRMLIENINFMIEYEKKVPRLDLTVPGNTGSHPAGWPFGWKAIRYRYQRGANSARHLYLQGNPVNWFIGFLGVVLALILVGGRYLFRLKIKEKLLFEKIQITLLLYAVYMYMMLGIGRVMYLYHYLVPLYFSFILAVMVFWYSYKEEWLQGNRWLRWGFALVVLQIVIAFAFFSPLTYYQPVNLLEFIMRSWSEIWGLQYAGLA